MNERVKSVALAVGRRLAPGLTGRLVARRIRGHIDRFSRSEGLDRILQQYVDAHGTTVTGGPFAGLRHLGRAAGSTTVPKLVGSYESELHPALAAAIGRCPPVVIDVGSAEGYYAVGLARALPATTVYAFDIDGLARGLCRRMAVMNGVADRVVIGGRCDPAALDRLLVPGALVVCDCEGYERDLLDPARTPALASATLIVELHEDERPGLTPLMLERFGPTHAVQLIPTVSRDPDHYPALAVLDPADRPKAVSEYRHGPQQWLVATAGARHAPGTADSSPNDAVRPAGSEHETDR